MNQQVTVGVILRPHGLHGVAKVRPTTDDPRRFRRLERVSLHREAHWLGDFRITHADVQGPQAVLVKFADCDTCESIDPLRGAEIRIARAEALPTQPNQFYHFDLLGLLVRTEAGRALGKIVQVLDYPANDIWVVHDDEHNELLLPAISSIIKEVNLEQGYVTITPLPGLFDDFEVPGK